MMFSFFKKSKYSDDEIIAIGKARMFPLEEVNDEVFSGKMLGDGVAFELHEDEICAPINGELSVLFPTGHAFGIKQTNGIEVLVHIGINTVALGGEGFTKLATQGQKVNAGDVIVKVDRKLIQQKGYDLSTVLLITEPRDTEVSFIAYGDVESKQRIN